MIILKADVFLFQKMGMMLLASGQNKSSLRAEIQRLNEHLNHTKSDERDPKYVRIEQTPALNNTINKVFNDTFIGCDTAWVDMNVEVKFSIIISTFWNRCFNSLWKLRIAAVNENALEFGGIERSSLPIGVREYEDRALRALATSIVNGFNDAASTNIDEVEDSRQALQNSSMEIGLLHEAQSKVDDLQNCVAEKDKTLQVQETAISSLLKAITSGTEENVLRSLAELHGGLPQNLIQFTNALSDLLLNAQRNNQTSQQQLGEKIEQLEWQLAQKSNALEVYEPPELAVAIPGQPKLTHAQLESKCKQVEAQVDEAKRKDTAIRELIEATNSDDGDKVSRNLGQLQNLPADVDSVKNVLVRALKQCLELTETKKTLEHETSQLKTVNSSQTESVKSLQEELSLIDSLIQAIKSEDSASSLRWMEQLGKLPEIVDEVRNLSYHVLQTNSTVSKSEWRIKELESEGNQVLQVCSESNKKLSDIGELIQIIANNDVEIALQTLAGCANLAPDVEHVKNGLGNWLLIHKKLAEEKNNLEGELGRRSQALQQCSLSLKTEEDAINALNQALASGSGGSILKALDAIPILPEKLQAIKDVLMDLLMEVRNKPVADEQPAEERAAMDYDNPPLALMPSEEHQLTSERELAEQRMAIGLDDDRFALVPSGEFDS